MSIKVWPKSERPREKLLQYGAENLSDAELIAVLLGKGVKGKEKNKAKKNAIFNSVKKASCNAVYINPWPLSLSINLTRGFAKNAKRMSAK